ncbi:carboxypeptidase-like regulatory domain-containing protein, partial [candidate division WOR-3 bacterium]|nr:carboxypeptidase-like regulatory domain-containing protein [candidate division WOR-3 bacterium]
MRSLRFQTDGHPFECRLLALVLLGAALAPVALAGVTGSIRGRIFDRGNGEALVGVNVIVTGTDLGAATDANGEYLIMNVPPGRYSLEASYVGYNPQTITDIVVVQDNATTVDFRLSVTVIELGRTVEVIA